MSIRYITGDATAPQSSGPKVIVHICNDIGGWGRGFVLALSARWKEPEARYREWHRQKAGFALGAVQFVPVQPDLWVTNLIGQHDTRVTPAGPPIRYEAVDSGLQKVAVFARENRASVHMPRIGCGLAGGTWDRIEPILEKHLHGLDVTVYDR